MDLFEEKVENEEGQCQSKKGCANSPSEEWQQRDEDSSFIKLIDSLSEFQLVCVFRQHRTQETGQARERKINCALEKE